GQKVLTDHPDNGKTVFTYNLAGQLVQLANQNLLDLGQYIEYVYSYNQLRKIIYPSHVVNYDYGSMNTTNQQINAVGRMQFIEDLTGTRTFKYGVLGEVVEEDRIITTQNSTMQFVTTSRYDAWGRLLEMEYPDGEHLTYNYNPVGQLKSIYSSDDIAYLRDVKYTFFDQPYEIVYGNDVKTTNHYDDMQRIRTMQIDRPSGNTFLHTHYTYDRNQNIVRLQNVASQHELIRMGGMFDKHYKYDKFNRLSHASGEWQGFDERHNYNLDMHYNATHGILKKDQYHFTENPHFSGTTENSYNATYQYDFPEHPHAPSQINYANGNVTEFQYDSNGNIIYLTSNSELIIHGERSFIWDEQNRLLAV